MIAGACQRGNEARTRNRDILVASAKRSFNGQQYLAEIDPTVHELGDGVRRGMQRKIDRTYHV